ncbi:MAG TPA: deoxyribodipyrimidine photo-lyase, partial [Allocoleopsis sp.]
MAEKRILIWFRNDLRLHDHEPLHEALQAGAEVIPFYCFDARQFGQTSFGFPKTGAFRAQFLLEAIADLRASLRSLGSDLIVRRGLPEAIIPELVKQLQISAIYCHGEVTSEETAVETALQTALRPLRVKLETFWGHTLYHPDNLPFEIAELPELFTNFRKQVEKYANVDPTFPTPQKLSSMPDVEVGELPHLSDLGLEPSVVDERAMVQFKGGEMAGLARLQEYFWQRDRLKIYKETRNGMLGADYSSKFSPWLSLGCLSPRYI